MEPACECLNPAGSRAALFRSSDVGRVAYVEALDDETTVTLGRFWRRAEGWFWSNDMADGGVLTDNGLNACSTNAASPTAEPGPSASRAHNLTRTDS